MSLFKWASRRGVYPMGEVTDTSGNGNTLTVSGATVVAGNLGNAYSLTLDDYLTANGVITSMASDTKGTIAGWLYLDADDGAVQIPFGISNGSGAARHDLLMVVDWTLGNNRLYIQVITGGVAQSQIQTPIDSLTSKIGGWMSFVIIHNGTQITNIYLDGVDQTLTRTVTTDETIWTGGVITAGADTVNFGCVNLNGVRSNFLEGDLDEWGLFGEPWDATDVAAFHNAGAGRVMNQAKSSELARGLAG